MWSDVIMLNVPQGLNEYNDLSISGTNRQITLALGRNIPTLHPDFTRIHASSICYSE